MAKTTKATAKSTAKSAAKPAAKSRKSLARNAEKAPAQQAEPGLGVQRKKELQGAQERTHPGRFYVPLTDIYEADDRLVVVMDMPGVDKETVDVRLEHDTLSVEGRIDFGKYKNLRPVYTEYNVGHYARSFVLSDQVERDGITASVVDGVLTLELPKSAQARRRRIPIG